MFAPTLIERDAGPPAAAPPDLSQLRSTLRAQGAFARPTRYYSRYAAVLVGATVALIVALAVAGATAPWWALLLAVPAAAISAQFGFLGHDAGHGQVARGRRNRAVGLLAGNLASGLSFGWWQDKHRRHHRLPNVVGEDPDVGDGVVAWNPDQRRRATGAHAWLVRHQHRLFPVLLTLEGWHLAWASIRSLRQRTRRELLTEVPLLAAHYIGLAALAWWLLPGWTAVAFVLAHRAVYGLLLGAAFAPNHIGMDMPTTVLDPLRRQVMTSRNVAGGPVLDLAMGGLNYQIEHHLFPSLPRPNLRAAAPAVRRFCEAHGLRYHAPGVRQAFVEVYRALAPPEPFCTARI